MKRVVVLTGAGISAESGLKTFRDTDGLWENYPIEDVATPSAWKRNPGLVLEFYRQRWEQMRKAEPNAAHYALVDLERCFHVDIITQNIDDLHERAGSGNVLHLHGQLSYCRSERSGELQLIEDTYIHLGDTAEDGAQLRPHVVWFGEAVPMLEAAAHIVSKADILMIVGSSLQVYPAASLYEYAPANCRIFVIDPHVKPSILPSTVHYIQDRATVGVPALVKELCSGANAQ